MRKAHPATRAPSAAPIRQPDTAARRPRTSSGAGSAGRLCGRMMIDLVSVAATKGRCHEAASQTVSYCCWDRGGCVQRASELLQRPGELCKWSGCLGRQLVEVARSAVQMQQTAACGQQGAPGSRRVTAPLTWRGTHKCEASTSVCSTQGAAPDSRRHGSTCWLRHTMNLEHAMHACAGGLALHAAGAKSLQANLLLQVHIISQFR